MTVDRKQTSQPGQRHCDPAYIKLRMPARGAEVSAPVRTFVDEKTVSRNFWKVFVARFSEIFRDFQTKRIREMERWLRSTVDWSEIFALIVFNKDWISIFLHSAWITIDYQGGCCKRRARGWEYSEKKLKCREGWCTKSQASPPTIPQSPIHSMHLDFSWPRHNIEGKNLMESCHHFTVFTEFATFFHRFCCFDQRAEENKQIRQGLSLTKFSHIPWKVERLNILWIFENDRKES